MLGKVIKYEFKSTGRFMMLLYGALLAVSVIMIFVLKLNIAGELNEGINVISNSTVFNIITVLLLILYAILITAVMTATFFYSINRFRINMLGNEGYLMHTLPVSTGTHVLAKGIVFSVWSVLSFIAVMLSFCIIGFGVLGSSVISELPAVNVLYDDFINSELARVLSSARFYVTLGEVTLLAAITLISGYFHIYASMSFGYSFNNHRTAASVGIYILLTIVHNTLYNMVLNMLSVSDMFYTTSFLVTSILFNAAIGACYYFIASYFLSRRLNLQ